jgi:hypothetical protein
MILWRRMLEQKVEKVWGNLWFPTMNSKIAWLAPVSTLLDPLPSESWGPLPVGCSHQWLGMAERCQGKPIPSREYGFDWRTPHQQASLHSETSSSSFLPQVSGLHLSLNLLQPSSPSFSNSLVYLILFNICFWWTQTGKEESKYILNMLTKVILVFQGVKTKVCLTDVKNLEQATLWSTCVHDQTSKTTP